MKHIDDSFLNYACDILGETDTGLSGAKIVEYCNSYAITFNRVIPYAIYPNKAPNKRTSLRDNLRVFSDVEQYRIIKELCELPKFADNAKVADLKIKLYTRYGNLATEKITETELVQKTKHWLSDYPMALKQYESALAKYEGGIFKRNTLDDLRLAFELLVKGLLGNNKSLENQIDGICGILDKAGTSVELKNMVPKIIDYYTKFQNSHVKHNDAVNSNEIEYVIELTSVIMKFLIKANGGQN
ncbi:hypothetical protein [Ruminococcus sp.]|uniref:hypothetical protein n=1 Tax=Ruminococcus sp. TaxID=41978 RepID=UPI0025CF01B2|nr:hypothetical protein [Ruminococcus sp.]MBR1431830.1 hypothetical protein [Ruminococcus sp.]